jgi:ABC-2 type transport system ATP-binding protein
MSVIETSELGKRFDGTRVLEGVSFSVDAGEVFGYLGPNGAGKTTTMRILLGLLKADSGTATVLGSDLARNDAKRGSVGVLLEDNGLYDRLTATENLGYYADLYEVPQKNDRIAELLAFVGLEDRSSELVGTFSTGMKRKLGLARAILHEPEVLFLDEPSTGLDPEAQRMVRELIVTLSARESITVFLNSHNLDEVQRICSKVAILSRGTIKAFDTVERLRQSEGSTTFAITLADPGQQEAALAVLREAGVVQEAWTDGAGITAAVSGTGTAPVLRALIAAGVGVEEARKLSRTLEEIYLEAVA